jgi:uncharacterized protein YegJ (DUF2314 family)
MYKPLQWKTLVILVLLLAACSPAGTTVTPSPGPVIVHTQIPTLVDEELAEAVHQAQETLHLWRQEFLAPKRAYSMTSLKVRFAGDGGVEDMWTEPMFVLDNVYTVKMVEGVTLEKGIHPNRLLDVRPEDIVDWMLLEKDGTVIGGYTLRLEYERMTPDQQKRYLEITGYKFE